ncbi:MAG: hypothetical protein DHS20C19_04560 [Acidimicrobiales bacterium]|nr:MAG: hypothetical protein DHS20C19_04560 [Acidimicrobiales bacterium]
MVLVLGVGFAIVVPACGDDGDGGTRLGMTAEELTTLCGPAQVWFDVRNNGLGLETTDDRHADAVAYRAAMRDALLEVEPVVVPGAVDKFDNDLATAVARTLELHEVQIQVFEEFGADSNRALDRLEALNDRTTIEVRNAASTLNNFVNEECAEETTP